MSADRLVIHPGQLRDMDNSLARNSLCGSKVAGVLVLPERWVPEFFVISSELFTRCRDAPGQPLGRALSKEERGYLERALAGVAPSARSAVMVRSSAADEDLRCRGRYVSASCKPSVKDVISTAERIFASATGCPSMALMVQRQIPQVRVSGHLSNERRLSERSSSWTLEYVQAPHKEPVIERLSRQHAQAPSPDARIQCGDVRQLKPALRRLVAWTSSLGVRIHYEWIWDGSTIWVVQADQETQRGGSAPLVAGWKQDAVPHPTGLHHFVREESIETGSWRKLDCVKTFRQCGLPTTDLWVLQDPDLICGLAESKVPDSLREDVRQLFSAPSIVRTDTDSRDERDRMMLPRTETLADSESALSFMVQHGGLFRELLDRGHRACFIVHRFIPCRTSAFCLAQPGKSRSYIDSLWGLAEGLQYYPHDSYEVDCAGKGKVSRHVRFKEDFLDVDSSGQWAPRYAAPPWDWRSSLTDVEALEIARATVAVFGKEQKPIQLMWFVGIPKASGHPPLLPWFYTTQEPSERIFPSSRAAYLTEPPVVIATLDDIARAKNELGTQATATFIRLHPTYDLLRSDEFIRGVTELATESKLPIELRGSVLQHAYYLLREAGVQIICSDPMVLKQERRVFDKLVRDLIPVGIESHGEQAVVVRMSGAQLANALRSKVVEEALELNAARDSEHLREEIADLLEVVAALARHEGITRETVEFVASKKKADRGGFDEGFILRETKELPVIRVASETTTLFGREDRSGGGGGETLASSARITGVPRGGRSSLRLPMIPPEQGSRNWSHEMSIGGVNLLANVRYSDKEILVDFHPRRPETGQSSQLRLDL